MTTGGPMKPSARIGGFLLVLATMPCAGGNRVQPGVGGTDRRVSTEMIT